MAVTFCHVDFSQCFPERARSVRFFLDGIRQLFPITWSGGFGGLKRKVRCSALGWGWLSLARLAVAVEKTAFNQFSDQDLPSSELPVRHYLVPICVLWKLRQLWMTVFTIWIRMTSRSCVPCGFGSVFLNIWDHIRKVSWKDSFCPQKESEALNAVEQH